ncbi:MAG: terpene cyclase/mutase family protein [Methanopyri archaeon]|jgi:hypothetical protein|nr:terpene cyclase/mutase family protein [Methanopyri archaeon]
MVAERSHQSVLRYALALLIILWFLGLQSTRMSPPAKGRDTVADGIAFLHSLQRDDGSFTLLRHDTSCADCAPAVRVSVITTALVMKHLATARRCGVATDLIDEVALRGRTFLLASSHDVDNARVWRFYPDDAYPPADADDTAASLVALDVRDPELAGTLAALARMQGPGGGFLTWFDPGGMPNTETITVSSRAATALTVTGTPFDREALCTFLHERFQDDHWTGAWVAPRPRYATYLALEASLVCGCDVPGRDAVIRYLGSSGPDGMDVLDLSLTVLALDSLGAPLPPDTVDMLKTFQETDGGFPDALFFTEGPMDTTIQFSDRAFTTAFAVSALATNTCPAGTGSGVARP